MKPLRDAMRREAGRIWHQMAQAISLGLFLNEETITETILLNLATQFRGGKLAVRPFTKAEETKNGADWEFWFVQGHDCLGLRVQAKRLFRSGCYNSLHPGGKQTSDLISHAGNCLPVFALYNDAHSFASDLPTCGCSEYRGPSLLGSLLVPARVVQLIGQNDHRALAPKAIPWHCLICEHSSCASGSTLPKLIAANYNRLLDGADTSKYEVEPEDRILDLVNMASEGHSWPQWLETYFERRKLAGLALISVRDEILD